MKCVNHSDRDALSACAHCGKGVCSECAVEVGGEFYCKDCVAKRVGGGGTVKEARSPVLAAILSFFISGLGQVYNGQVGKGILIFLFGWLIIPWIIGVIDAYRVAVKINNGELSIKSKPGCLIGCIVGIVIFFFAVFVIALLAAIAIPNLLRARLNANESQAQATLKTISTAIESYAIVNNGVYPDSLSALVKAKPSYLQEDYTLSARAGYTYRFEPSPSGYKVMAKPIDCDITGTKIYTVETGGILSSQDCQPSAR